MRTYSSPRILSNVDSKGSAPPPSSNGHLTHCSPHISRRTCALVKQIQFNPIPLNCINSLVSLTSIAPISLVPLRWSNVSLVPGPNYKIAISQSQFLPEASFGLRVLSLPASVCVCVRACASTPPPPPLVRAITHHPFKLGSPNLDHRCKRPWLRSLLFWGVIDLDLQKLPNFELVGRITQSPVQARTTKFGPKVPKNWVKIPINFGIDWSWSSISFSILKPVFLPNLFALFFVNI